MTPRGWAAGCRRTGGPTNRSRLLPGHPVDHRHPTTSWSTNTVLRVAHGALWWEHEHADALTRRILEPDPSPPPRPPASEPAARGGSPASSLSASSGSRRASSPWPRPALPCRPSLAGEHAGRAPAPQLGRRGQRFTAKPPTHGTTCRRRQVSPGTDGRSGDRPVAARPRAVGGQGSPPSSDDSPLTEFRPPACSACPGVARSSSTTRRPGRRNLRALTYGPPTSCGGGDARPSAGHDDAPGSTPGVLRSTGPSAASRNDDWRCGEDKGPPAGGTRITPSSRRPGLWAQVAVADLQAVGRRSAGCPSPICRPVPPICGCRRLIAVFGRRRQSANSAMTARSSSP